MCVCLDIGLQSDHLHQSTTPVLYNFTKGIILLEHYKSADKCFLKFIKVFTRENNTTPSGTKQRKSILRDIQGKWLGKLIIGT